MPELLSIIVASVVSLGVALAVLGLSRKAGLSDVDKTLSTQRGALVATLTYRVEHLENENTRLTEDNEYLRHELEQLRIEVQRLERYIIKHRVGDSDDA